MIKNLEILLIKSYQKISHPVYNVMDRLKINFPKCRYTPSCSEYAIESIQKYGIKRGTIMGFKRIMRCNPNYPRGHDPVE